MNERVLTIVSVAAAVLAVFVALEWWALILLALGLLAGFMNPEGDPVQRMVILVAALGLPHVADSLDVIPQIGGHINSIIDNVAAVLAGTAVANFLMALKDRLMPPSSSGPAY